MNASEDECNDTYAQCTHWRNKKKKKMKRIKQIQIQVQNTNYKSANADANANANANIKKINKTKEINQKTQARALFWRQRMIVGV